MSALASMAFSPTDSTALCVWCKAATEPTDEAAGRGARTAHAAIQAALTHLIGLYADAAHPGVLATVLADADTDERALAERPAASLRRLAAAFATPALSADAEGRTAALLLLGALLDNDALAPQRSLLDAPCVRPRSRAGRLLRELEARLADEAPLTALGASLPALLRAPAEASPTSLDGQLAYILEAWDEVLTDALRLQLLRARDLVAETEAARFSGPGPAEVLDFGTDEGFDGAPGRARFSDDGAWMPNLVLAARQALVWLDQLSSQYGRSITTLDQVPDEELDELAARGFTGLWLIGLWERSPASREIKQRMGNPEAESSAYALWDYVIADRLGGEHAYQQLHGRATARGIRLAADMVPNHVGLDSQWVQDHPEWFVQTEQPPFPGYRFDGPDLSSNPDVGIRLEDGYWNHSDAAVVFQRVDHRSGEVRYLYHGNDGTQMPWNDTAQLDYLNPEVREAVIQTILGVARRASVIRFDAAMTLAKKHVQRLWHPAPGSGGAIPSRAERAASPDAFDEAMPREFWREVVQRVREEVPDTLLLAEAFWMMEGTFVRDFGMHRVYNSAFMHMLRDEDNAGYRQSIKNVLEYSPAILERFVNFMNNPDEETAVEQFGKGDKYFGICTLMATLPGLPMFGHGQIEGFAEKYGMEFARAYADESADAGFVAHHQRAIFPLLRQRHVFSGVEHFALFDLVDGDGATDENVFAFSNRGDDGTQALVIYNNAHTATAGRLRLSTAINVADADAEQPFLERRALGDALGLKAHDGVLYGMHDARTGLWYLRSGADLHREGLWVSLDGYGCHTFLGFREIVDHDSSWSELMAELWGHGVPDLDAARRERKARRIASKRAAVEAPSELPEGLAAQPTAHSPQPC